MWEKLRGTFILIVYWIQSRYFYRSQFLISLPFLLHLFLHCKVFSMSWSHPSSTPVVSRSLAGCLAPGAPLALRCQGPQRQSPEPSAARVTRTRTKSASTTATWISSGSTPPSKICPVGWLLNIEALPVVLSRTSSDWHGRLTPTFVMGGVGSHILTDIWSVCATFFFFLFLDKGSCAVKPVTLQTAVTFQATASPAESNR